MVVVLVDELTERMRYTFDFIFEFRGLQYTLVDDIHQFDKIKNGKLNYSNHKIEGIISIPPSGLLIKDSIWKGKIEAKGLKDIEVISFNGIEDSVASIFYVLSRMEEYNCENYDEHGRFPFSQSILKKFSWIEKAMCDRWAHYIIKELLNVGITTPQGSFVPTFDIDNTYAYKYKTGNRKIFSVIRDLIKFDRKRLKERRLVKNGETDPYDTFEKIEEISKKNKNAKVFWLVESSGLKDRNLSIEITEHQLLIKKIAQSVEVNIHPSYGSFLNACKIRSEKEKLQIISGTSIVSSRQHFLRFQLPQSYRDLINAGISDDYSMGFAEHIGFRSGTAHSHKWFDLKLNTVTGLSIHPFVYMDGTLREYMLLTKEEGKVKIRDIYDEVQSFGGDFIFLWHNETIGDYGDWEGWSDVLDFTLSLKNE